jgi:hypothetical protein
MKAALIIALVGWIVATGEEAHYKKEECKKVARALSDGNREVYKEEFNFCMTGEKNG